ncbi:MAG TPA: mechanosensitive ion channel domain-containing protein [Gammaproteobacteria bacterium]|jgi:small-conductance mechanosensitive channel|nr:mechanosensitive ion channel domain-containing protein [Gammaproteobacteria bacterium]
MDQLLSPDGLVSVWRSFYAWLRNDALVPDHTLQAVIVVVSLGAAMLIARSFRRWLARRYAQPPAGRGAQIVAFLAMPVVWLLLLWLALSISNALGRPRGLLDTVATLVAAWIGIHLASQVVKNPLWSKLITWTAWSIAALSIVGLLDPTIAALDSVGIQAGQLRISIYTVLRSTVALAVLLSVALYFTGLIEARIRTSRALSPTVQVLFTKSLRTVLVAFAVLIAVHSVGIDLTALAVVGGAIGLGAGFGLQKIVSNLIAGVILLIDRSVKPGDVIAVSGTYGWVTALGGRYVSVVTRDGVEHLIPNETLISERVENWTHTHSRTRLKVDLRVHYRSDLKRVMAICEEAARENPRVLADPAPKCLLLEFGDSALKLQLRFWIADAQNGVQNVKSEVLLRIWELFRQQDIEVPYPQHDLHIRSSATTLEPVSGAA